MVFYRQSINIAFMYERINGNIRSCYRYDRKSKKKQYIYLFVFRHFLIIAPEEHNILLRIWVLDINMFWKIKISNRLKQTLQYKKNIIYFECNVFQRLNCYKFSQLFYINIKYTLYRLLNRFYQVLRCKRHFLIKLIPLHTYKHILFKQLIRYKYETRGKMLQINNYLLENNTCVLRKVDISLSPNI